MTCKNCIIAGRIVSTLGDVPTIPLAEADQIRLHQIEYWHGRCLAPTTCPCQHKIPEVTNG